MHGQNFIDQQVVEWSAGLGRLHRPIAHGRSGQFDAKADKLQFLTTKRIVIDKLAGKDIGQQAGSGDGLGDDLGWNRGNLDGRTVILDSFAGPAGILGPDMANDPRLGRYDIQLLQHFFADSAKEL